MGVPKFYRWISERYPCLSEIVTDRQIPEFDNLYLDMNGIIHSCTHPNDDDVSFRISEEQIFRDIFHYIDTLFSIIEPKKVFFMAIDGVAPRAKMNQQRARRFMSAKNAELAMKVAKSKGQEIPEEKRFDPNCITPGTEFMARLHEQLQYFVKMKVSTDVAWQGIRIYLSGHNCPGEGEHKIMDFIRSERSQPDYDVNTRHCLYGLDADLIMLGLCSHEPHFSLLREEVKFGRPPKYKQKGAAAQKTGGVEHITFHLLHLSLLREYLSWEFRSIEDKLSFAYNVESIIDDWVLMGFLIGNDFIPHLPHVHIHEDALPVLYKTYMEVLPQLDGYLNENGILNLQRFEKFLKVFSKIDRQSFVQIMDDENYLASKRNETSMAMGGGGGSSSRGVDGHKSKSIRKKTPNGDDEEEDLELHPYSDSDMEMDEEETAAGAGEIALKGQSKAKGAFDSDSEGDDGSSDEAKSREAETKFELPSACELLSDGLPPSDEDNFAMGVLDEDDYENDFEIAWTHTVNRAFKNHKRDYYTDKLKYENISKEELREQAEGYIRALQWNLHYYYHGCCSWNWFYPHHYAPYISDVCDFANMEMGFEMSKPFLPFEQLMAVLPAGSAECLPPALRELMFDANSPILDFFPQDFTTDLNGKKNDWEAVVLIPFINEARLLNAIASKQSKLTDEEKRRNSHGPHLLFTTDSSSVSLLKSSLPSAFPDIQNCIAKVTEVDMDEFRISRSRIAHGLLSGVRLDVHFPGFPTMKHIPHTAELIYANVCVFQMPSKKQSMILKVSERSEFDKDMLEVAFDLIDKEVHVDWPILKRALVHSIWTPDKKYTKEGEDIVCEELTEEEQSLYDGYVMSTRKREFERYGIEVNTNAGAPNKAVALVRRMLGVQYGVKKRKVVAIRQWCAVDDLRPVSLNLVVQGVLEESRRDGGELSLEEAYPVNSTVFIISSSSKYYGFGVLIRENNLLAKSSLTVSCTAPLMDVDLSDLVRNYDRLALPWFSLFEMAKRTALSRDVAARITGCVFMNTCDRPSTATEAVYSTDRLAIGLELKFSKRNQLVPDYARRTKEGYWQYSFKAVILIQQYQQKFPEIFKCMQKRSGNDEHVTFFADDVWPELTAEERQQRVKELSEFLQTLPTASITRETADGRYVESRIISEIERRTQLVCAAASKDVLHKRLALKPSAVYRDELNKGGTIPDENTEYDLLDRVVCVRKTRNAPFGQRGTVVGIIGDSIETQKIDVLFDTEFFGGRKIRSERASGARLSASVLINLTYGMRARGELSNNSHRLVDSFDSALRTSGGNGRKTTGNNNNNNNNRMQYKPNWKGNNGNGKSAGRMRPGAELPIDFSASAGSSQVDPWTPRALKAQASSKISSSEGVTITTRKHEDESTSTRNSHRKPHERMQKEEVSYENREKIIEPSGYGRPPTYLIEKNVRTNVTASEDAINAEAAKIIAQIEQKLTQKKVKTDAAAPSSVTETMHVDEGEEEDKDSVAKSENEMQSEELVNDILKKLMVGFDDMNVENEQNDDDKRAQNELSETDDMMRILSKLSQDPTNLNDIKAVEKSPPESCKATAANAPAPSASEMFSSIQQQEKLNSGRKKPNQPTNSAIQNRTVQAPIGSKNNSLGKKSNWKSTTKGSGNQQMGLLDTLHGLNSPHGVEQSSAVTAGGMNAPYLESFSSLTPLEGVGGAGQPSYSFFDPWTLTSPGRTPLTTTTTTTSTSPAPAFLFTMPPPTSRQASASSCGGGGAPGPFAAPPPPPPPPLRSQPNVLQRSREPPPQQQQQRESLPTSVYSLFDRFDSSIFSFSDEQTRNIFHPINPPGDFTTQPNARHQQNPLFRTPKFPQNYQSASKFSPQTSHFLPSTIRFPTPQTPPPNHLFFSTSPTSLNSPSFQQSPTKVPVVEMFTTGVADGTRGTGSNLTSAATAASSKNMDKKKNKTNINVSKNLSKDSDEDKTDRGAYDKQSSSEKIVGRNSAAGNKDNTGSFTADPIQCFIDTIATQQQQMQKLDLSPVYPPIRRQSGNRNNNSSNNKRTYPNPNQSAPTAGMAQHKQAFGRKNEPAPRGFDRHQLHLNLTGTGSAIGSATSQSTTNRRHQQQHWKVGGDTGGASSAPGSAHQTRQYHPYNQQRISSSASEKPPSDMTPTQVMKRTVTTAQNKSNEDEETSTAALLGSHKAAGASKINNNNDSSINKDNNGNKKSISTPRNGNNNNNNGKQSSKSLSSTAASPQSPQTGGSSSPAKRISSTKTAAASQQYGSGGGTAGSTTTGGGTASRRGARGARKSRVAAKFN